MKIRESRLNFTRHFTVKTQYKIVKMDSVYFSVINIRRKLNFHLEKEKKRSSLSGMVFANKTIISKK